MSDNNTLNDSMEMTREKLESLKRHYKSAVEKKKETFEFEGRQLMTGYAKYMIEYLEGQFGKSPNADRR